MEDRLDALQSLAFNMERRADEHAESRIKALESEVDSLRTQVHFLRVNPAVTFPAPYPPVAGVSSQHVGPTDGDGVDAVPEHDLGLMGEDDPTSDEAWGYDPEAIQRLMQQDHEGTESVDELIADG